MNFKNLLRKEIKLETNLSIYIWILCDFLFYFIPTYPVYIGSFYITLGIMMTFTLNQVSHGLMYSVMLPVRKIDTVKARFLYCGLLELLFIPFAIIAFFIRKLGHFPANNAGIDLNLAYCGFQLIILSLFNIAFLGNIYKNPLKAGKPYLFGSILYFAGYALFELPIWQYRGAIRKIGYLPQDASLFARFGEILSKTDFAGQLKQIPVLAAGILIFILSWLITFPRAARQFEKYDM